MAVDHGPQSPHTLGVTDGSFGSFGDARDVMMPCESESQEDLGNFSETSGIAGDVSLSQLLEMTTQEFDDAYGPPTVEGVFPLPPGDPGSLRE